MAHPSRSAAPPHEHPAQGRAYASGAVYRASRAPVHDGVTFMHVSTDWDHDRFREYVINHAKRAKVAHDQGSLSKVVDIDTGSLGRYFRGQVQPSEGNLEKIHRAVPGTTMKDLRILAGRAKPSEYEMDAAPAAPPTQHPLADKVSYLLGDNSPIDATEQALLTSLLERVLDSYPAQGVRRRSA